MNTVRIENKVKTAMFIIKNCSDEKRQLSAIIELIYECQVFKKACEDVIAIAEGSAPGASGPGASGLGPSGQGQS